MEESPCEFFKKLEKEGLVKKTSASLSEVVFGKDENGDKISAKIFLDYTRALENKEIKEDDFLLRKSSRIKSLIYEGEMYDLITELCSPSCPNFVRSLGTARCTQDVLTLEMKARLNGLYKNLLLNYPECPVVITFTERIGSPTTLYSLHSFMEYFSVNSRNILNVLFQLVFALTTMQKYRVIHHDLHTGNILIKTLNKPLLIDYLYIEDGKEYLFRLEIRQQLYIFDWDYGYCEILGDNPRFDNDDIKCLAQNQCNTYIPGYDLNTVLCSIGWGILPNCIYEYFMNSQIHKQDSITYDKKILKKIKSLKEVSKGIYEITDDDKFRELLNIDSDINLIVVLDNGQVLPILFTMTLDQAQILTEISTRIRRDDEGFHLLRESKELKNLEFIPKDFRDNIISVVYKFIDIGDGRYGIISYVGHKCRTGFVTKDMPIPSEILRNCFTSKIIENVSDINIPRYTLNMDEKFFEYKRGTKVRKLSKELQEDDNSDTEIDEPAISDSSSQDNIAIYGNDPNVIDNPANLI